MQNGVVEDDVRRHAVRARSSRHARRRSPTGVQLRFPFSGRATSDAFVAVPPSSARNRDGLPDQVTHSARFARVMPT